MKTALIFGISGQDGAYLSRLLLGKGYRVVGASRDAQISPFRNLELLGIRDQVSVQSVSLIDFRSVLQCLTSVKPDEVYNFSGQSSVGLSFEQPVETFESITIGTINLLEAIRFIGSPIRLYNACSSECFGEGAAPADETTAFRPRSPYAVAKAAAFWEVSTYRQAYGIYACSGILFNHESPLRPERFVTQKVIRSACRIAQGAKEKLEIGNVEIRRDWGWAPEFVDGMHRMMIQPEPGDYVLATGQSHSLQEFIEMAFTAVGLKWRDHVVVRKENFRPLDIRENLGNAGKAARILNWKASTLLPETVQRMIAAFRSDYRELKENVSH